MRIDAQNEFSDAQAVTATALSTNVIDLGQVSPKIMGGEDLFVNVVVGTTFTGSGGTMRAIIWTDDTATVTDGEDVITGDIRTVANNQLDAGEVLLRVNLKAIPRLQRYIGIQYVVAGATLAAGTIDAGLVITPDTESSTLT